MLVSKFPERDLVFFHAQRCRLQLTLHVVFFCGVKADRFEKPQARLFTQLKLITNCHTHAI